ncbi:MAG: helix-turn-helix domain-containing protein [Anaerolineae bacterium]
MIAPSVHEAAPQVERGAYAHSIRGGKPHESGGPLQQAAQTIAERLAELLCAPITVRARGMTLAFHTPPQSSGLFGLSEEAATPSLSVSCQIRGDAGEVVVGRPLHGEVVSLRLAQALVELVISQTMLLEQRPDRNELKNRFIHDLLRGHLRDEDEILRQARILQIDLSQPRAVILIDAADYILAPPNGRDPDDAMIRRRAEMVISSVVGFFHLPNDTICAYIGDGEVAVLKASNTRNLIGWAKPETSPDQWNSSWANLSALKRASRALLSRLQSDTLASVSIGIGRYHPGLRGLTSSYADACAARSLGHRFHGGSGVYCLDELGIPAFVGVSDEETKVDLAQYLLSPLDHEPDLLETLDAFFAENCVPSLTAQRLTIHRNTLAYRLEKIASLTGLDPRKFDEAVQIRLALLLRSLAGAPTVEAPPSARAASG